MTRASAIASPAMITALNDVPKASMTSPATTNENATEKSAVSAARHEKSSRNRATTSRIPPTMADRTRLLSALSE